MNHKLEIESALRGLKDKYLNKNFDTVNEIVDILISSDSTVSNNLVFDDIIGLSIKLVRVKVTS